MTGDTANGKSMSVIKALLPRKFEFGDRPRGGHAEHQVAGNRDGRDVKREPHRGPRHRIGDGDEVRADALGQRLHEHDQQRQQQEQAQEQQRHGNQHQAGRPLPAPSGQCFSGRHVATGPSVARR